MSFSTTERPIVKLIFVVLTVPSETVESFNVHFAVSSLSIVIVYLPGRSFGSASPCLRTMFAIAVPSSCVSVVSNVTLTPSGISPPAAKANTPPVIPVGAQVASEVLVIHVLTPEPLSFHICETSTRFWM